MSKRKLIQGKKPQSDSSQSSILSYFNKPRKSLKVEQEERLLAHDPISSYSQSSFFNSQEVGFSHDTTLFNSQQSFEDAPSSVIMDTQPIEFSPILFDIKAFNESQQTNISEFPSEPEINIPSPQPKEVEEEVIDLMEPKRPRSMIPNGLTERAFQSITKEKQDYDRWEMMVHGQMAKYGSIVKVCQKQPEVYLFRMLKTWAEGNLVFSWCVLLKEEEIHYLLSNAESTPNTQSDSIKDFQSQHIPLLPEYVQEEDEEKILFAFSFCFTHARVSLENFIQHEQVVGVWPDWSEVNLELEHYGLCEVNLARRFKADSIY